MSEALLTFVFGLGVILYKAGRGESTVVTDIIHFGINIHQQHQKQQRRIRGSGALSSLELAVGRAQAGKQHFRRHTQTLTRLHGLVLEADALTNALIYDPQANCVVLAKRAERFNGEVSKLLTGLSPFVLDFLHIDIPDEFVLLPIDLLGAIRSHYISAAVAIKQKGVAAKSVVKQHFHSVDALIAAYQVENPTSCQIYFNKRRAKDHIESWIEQETSRLSPDLDNRVRVPLSLIRDLTWEMGKGDRKSADRAIMDSQDNVLGERTRRQRSSSLAAPTRSSTHHDVEEISTDDDDRVRQSSRKSSRKKNSEPPSSRNARSKSVARKKNGNEDDDDEDDGLHRSSRKKNSEPPPSRNARSKSVTKNGDEDDDDDDDGLHRSSRKKNSEPPPSRNARSKSVARKKNGDEDDDNDDDGLHRSSRKKNSEPPPSRNARSKSVATKKNGDEDDDDDDDGLHRSSRKKNTEPTTSGSSHSKSAARGNNVTTDGGGEDRNDQPRVRFADSLEASMSGALNEEPRETAGGSITPGSFPEDGESGMDDGASGSSRVPSQEGQENRDKWKRAKSKQRAVDDGASGSSRVPSQEAAEENRDKSKRAKSKQRAVDDGAPGPSRVPLPEDGEESDGGDPGPSRRIFNPDPPFDEIESPADSEGDPSSSDSDSTSAGSASTTDGDTPGPRSDSDGGPAGSDSDPEGGSSNASDIHTSDTSSNESDADVRSVDSVGRNRSNFVSPARALRSAGVSSGLAYGNAKFKYWMNWGGGTRVCVTYNVGGCEIGRILPGRFFGFSREDKTNTVKLAGGDSPWRRDDSYRRIWDGPTADDVQAYGTVFYAVTDEYQNYPPDALLPPRTPQRPSFPTTLVEVKYYANSRFARTSRIGVLTRWKVPYSMGVNADETSCNTMLHYLAKKQWDTYAARAGIRRRPVEELDSETEEEEEEEEEEVSEEESPRFLRSSASGRRRSNRTTRESSARSHGSRRAPASPTGRMSSSRRSRESSARSHESRRATASPTGMTSSSRRSRQPSARSYGSSRALASPTGRTSSSRRSREPSARSQESRSRTPASPTDRTPTSRRSRDPSARSQESRSRTPASPTDRTPTSRRSREHSARSHPGRSEAPASTAARFWSSPGDRDRRRESSDRSHGSRSRTPAAATERTSSSRGERARRSSRSQTDPGYYSAEEDEEVESREHGRKSKRGSRRS